MEFVITQMNTALVIAIVGSIDALTASEVQNIFEKHLANREVQLVADLSRVDFMSSAGLRAILAIAKQARQYGGDLHLAAATPSVEKMLKISGFTHILKTFPSVEEAVSSI